MCKNTYIGYKVYTNPLRGLYFLQYTNDVDSVPSCLYTTLHFYILSVSLLKYYKYWKKKQHAIRPYFMNPALWVLLSVKFFNLCCTCAQKDIFFLNTSFFPS